MKLLFDYIEYSKEQYKEKRWFFITKYVLILVASTLLTALLVNMFASMLHFIGRRMTVSGTILISLILFFSSALVGQLILINVYRNMSAGRRIKVSKNDTHGSARMLEGKELKETFNIVSVEEAQGEIFGRTEPNGKMCYTLNYFDLAKKEGQKINRNKIVIGAPGTGKSVSIMIPDIIQLLNAGESIIATDTKGEIYLRTANYARSLGYTVKVFNLINKECSDSCRLFVSDYCSIKEAREFIHLIYSSSVTGRVLSQRKDFWEMVETNVMLAAMLYIAHDPVLGAKEKHIPENESQKQKEERLKREYLSKRNLYELYQFLSKPFNDFKEVFKKISKEHPSYAAYMSFLNSSEAVQQQAYSSAAQQLLYYSDTETRNMTSYNDIDLELPAKQKCIYYVIVKDHTNVDSQLTSMFFSRMQSVLVDYADKSESLKCDIPVNFKMDEFISLGYFDNWHRFLATSRSRQINVTMIVQNFPLFDDTYGPNRRKAIIDCCAINVLLGTNDIDETAKYYESRGGKMTVESQNTGKSSSSSGSTTGSESTSETGRSTLLADEVLKISQDEMLVYISRHNPLKAYVNNYFEMPQYTIMEQLGYESPNSHSPYWAQIFAKEKEERERLKEERKKKNKELQEKINKSSKNKTKPKVNVTNEGQMEFELDKEETIDPLTGEVLNANNQESVSEQPLEADNNSEGESSAAAEVTGVNPNAETSTGEATKEENMAEGDGKDLGEPKFVELDNNSSDGLGLL